MLAAFTTTALSSSSIHCQAMLDHRLALEWGHVNAANADRIFPGFYGM